MNLGTFELCDENKFPLTKFSKPTVRRLCYADTGLFNTGIPLNVLKVMSSGVCFVGWWIRRPTNISEERAVPIFRKEECLLIFLLVTSW
jgi:hypothetical protein